MTEPTGEDVRRERLARSWSQAELAHKAGVSTNTVNRIENGRDYASPLSLHKVLRALALMSPRPRDLREERLARGWSQAEVARRAGVSTNTVNRIENARDHENPRLLPQVARALGLLLSEPDSAPPTPTPKDEGPPLRLATAGQLAAELTRRLLEHEQLLAREGPRVVAHDRIRTGELPPGLSSRPDVGKGPRVAPDGEAESSS